MFLIDNLVVERQFIFNVWNHIIMKRVSAFSVKLCQGTTTDKSSEGKACCSDRFLKYSMQIQPTCQHWNAATLWPLCLSAANQWANTLPKTHFQPPPPSLTRQLASRPWDTAPPHPPPYAPHSPLPSPLPLTPSATDYCLLSLSSVALLVWGAGRNVTLLSGPPLHPPPLHNLAWPHSQSSKAPSVSPNSQGVRERERWGKKGKENKARRKEMTAEEGGEERVRKGDRTGGIWMVVALSVVKYLSNSFHSVKVSLLLFFLQTWCLLIFFLSLLYLPLIFYFLKSSNPPMLFFFFPLCVFPPLNFLSDYPITVPLTRFFAFLPPVSILPSILPPSRHRSFILL